MMSQLTDLRNRISTDPEFRQAVSRMRSAALYQARIEKPEAALHEIMNEILGEQYPGIALVYTEALEFLKATTSDPLESLPEPTTAEHWIKKAHILEGEGLWCNGLVSLAKAFELDSGSTDAWTSRGHGLLKLANAACLMPRIQLATVGHEMSAELLNVLTVLRRVTECYDRALSAGRDAEEATCRNKEPVAQEPRRTARVCPDYTGDPCGPHKLLEVLRRDRENPRVHLRPQGEYERLYRNNPDLLALTQTLQPQGRDDDMLRGMLDDLLSGMSVGAQASARGQIAVGELLAKEANASLIEARTPYKGYVMLVTRGWRTLLNSIGKVLLMTAETTPGTYTASAPFVANGSDDEAVHYFRDLLSQLQNKHLPHIAPDRLLLPDSKMYFLALLNVYSVVFTIGHELGHLLCGHLSSSQSPKQELEADQAGFALLLNWLYKGLLRGDLMDSHIEAAITGAELVFAGMLLLESCGLCPSGSHPPMADRFNALREAFALSDAVYELPNMMMKKALELRNQAVRLGTAG